MSQAGDNTLDYDRARAPTPMVALHYVARVCAVGPMIVGVLVFLLYLATRRFDFAILGFFTILGGCAAAFVGAVCLAVYWFQARRANADDAALARRNAKRDAVLLLVNFPLAGLLAFVGITMMNRDAGRVNVVVHNADTIAAERVILDTGGHTTDVGPIAPGTSAGTRIEFGSRGLTATLVRGGSSTSHPIFDHMDGDTVLGRSDLRLVIRDGQVALQE